MTKNTTMNLETSQLCKYCLDFDQKQAQNPQNVAQRGCTMSVSANDILSRVKDEKVHFMRLQFTDIDGIIKNVEVPESQFEKALDGQIMFDGSSIEGFTRIEESDMLLTPDMETFQVFPWEANQGKVCRLVCDVALPDGSPFVGCPRGALKRVVAKARDMGYTMMAGPEAGVLSVSDRRQRRRDPDHPRLRRLLRSEPARSRRGGSPRYHSRARGHGSRGRSGPPRSRPRPARDRLQVRRRRGHRGCGRHLPLRGQKGRPHARPARHLHAQTTGRGQRLGDARPPVALHPRRQQRLLRRRRSVPDLRRRSSLYRRSARPRPRDGCPDQSAGQLLQASGPRLRGARQRRLVGKEPLAHDPGSGAARDRHPVRSADTRPVVQPLSRLCRHAGRRPRRHRARARLRRTGQPQYLRHVGP